MTSELGVSFHSDNYAKKQNIDGENRTAHRASSGAYPRLYSEATGAQGCPVNS